MVIWMRGPYPSSADGRSTTADSLVILRFLGTVFSQNMSNEFEPAALLSPPFRC